MSQIDLDAYLTRRRMLALGRAAAGQAMATGSGVAAASAGAAAPDFAMTSFEITPVMRTMRSLGWDLRCQYNQETDEHPQLYFSHQLKKANPYAVTREIRGGLDHTASTESPR